MSLILSAMGEPPTAPGATSGASDAGRPRPKKKRSRVAAVTAAAMPAASSRTPATIGAAASRKALSCICLLYTSDAADEEDSVDLGGRRIITKKNKQTTNKQNTHIEHLKE